MEMMLKESINLSLEQDSSLSEQEQRQLIQLHTIERRPSGR